ncbi:hypothetical protein LBMAG27_09630 [Bacteroidota bacterium]|nr:hypothetical protein LBMAG27_09630 [Bacteroidota bacterium]
MHLEILTPESKIFTGEATAVQMQGTDGSFQVLNHHAPMISSLKEGNIKVDHDKTTTNFKVMGGFVEVADNKVTVLVEGLQK